MQVSFILKLSYQKIRKTIQLQNKLFLYQKCYYDIMIFMKMKAEISFKLLGIHTLYIWSPADITNILQIVELKL